MEKLMIRYVLKTLGSIRSALAVGVGLPFLIAANAYGQAATPVPTEATTERVIVTGSYIPTAETESALPVTVYTAEVLKKQGANTPVEGIRQLPSFVGNAATENDSNGGDGTATINLRGIGSVNVLVLINTRRTFNFNDINLISIGAVSRTEILKDGASAIYGSDGVAGVVNFILLDGPGEKPYECAELYALYGNTTETDAHVRQGYRRGGVTCLERNVALAASGEYYSRSNLFSKDRAKVAGTGDTFNDPAGLGLGGPNNNSPTFAGRVSVSASASNLFSLTGQLVLSNLSNNQASPGAYRRFDAIPGTDTSRFNLRAFTSSIPAMEKALYFVTGSYKIFGDGMVLYGDLLYSKAKQDNGLAGAPFTISNTGNGLTEARASQFNPFGGSLASVRYRLQNTIGPRRDFFDKDAWRYVVGIKGDFNFKDNGFISRFGYDTGFVYERFDELRVDSGDATRGKIRQGIAGTLTRADGSPIDPTGTPVFFNPFIGQNAPVIGSAPTYVNGVPTGLMANYNNLITSQVASYIGHSEFYERDYMYDAHINAHLFPNLWDGGWDFAAGYERRNRAQHSVPDPVQAANDQLGFNQSPNTKTLQEINAVYLQLGVPIVTSTMNVPFVRSFDIDIAWRYEKFDDFNQGDPGNPFSRKQKASFDNPNPDEDFGGSPRVSLRYQPTPDITFRATWGQSFRSPSPANLFDPIIQDFPVVFDRLRNNTLQPPEGVWRSGNAALQPEKTDTYSAGIVYTPKWLPGFTMTVDAYQIWTTRRILNGDSFAQVLLTNNVVDPSNNCNGTSTNLGIVRNPDGTGGSRVDGSLECINSHTANAGKRQVEGVDATAVYEIPTDRWGKFTFSGGYNHFFIWKEQPGPGLPFK